MKHRRAISAAGRLLLHHLDARRLSQAELARQCEMPRTLVVDIIWDRRSIPLKRFAALVKAFDLDETQANDLLAANASDTLRRANRPVHRVSALDPCDA